MNKKIWIALFIIGLLAPFVVYPVLLMKLLCFALFASTFNLLLGFTGLLSFGHAAFFGGAAYTAGYLIKEFSLNPELGILAGTLVAGVLGFVFGSLAIRRQGITFAMITLGLAEIVYFVATKASFTHGEDGLQGIPRGKVFGLINLDHQYQLWGTQLELNLYYFVFAIFCVGFWLIYRTIYSPFGEVLKAIRDNELRATSLGYKTERFKLLAFVISAALAGTAGAMKALVFQVATLTDVHVGTSTDVVLMVLLGGVGTILGPVVGASTIVMLQSELSAFGSWVTVIIGITFMVCVLAFRRGIIGNLARLLNRSL